MTSKQDPYASVLRIADVPSNGTLCTIVGRIFRVDQHVVIRDWSGTMTLFAQPEMTLPDFSLVEAKGQRSGHGFHADTIHILTPDIGQTQLNKAQTLRGPERLLFRPELRPFLRARSSLLSFTRSYFEGKGFEAVLAPSLMEESTTDPNIALFESKYAPLAGAGETGVFYLQSSPELALKRALVSGAKAIYHAGFVYRNGEADATHRPEFLMLEWYRVGASLNDLMDETEAFVRALFSEAKGQGFTPHCSLDAPFERLQMPALFQESTGVDLLASFEGAELGRALEDQGLGPFPEGSDFEEVFHQALVERVQDRLASIPASFVYEYPAPLALLSRLDPNDARKARRVEAFIGAVEIANGFEELTDPSEYRRRFQRDREIRAKRGLSTPSLPEDFLASMDLGLPPCSGIAIGLDRLIQLACGADDISEITTFVVPE